MGHDDTVGATHASHPCREGVGNGTEWAMDRQHQVTATERANVESLVGEVRP